MEYLHSNMDRLKRVKAETEKRDRCGALVYVNNIQPIFVAGGTTWSFKGEFLYVYDLDGDKVAAFMAESVLGVSLGGDDVSK